MRGLFTGVIGLGIGLLCAGIERRTKTMPPTGDREIDRVLDANQSPALRMLHAGYGDILTMHRVTARQFETVGLIDQARELREKCAALDTEFAKAMTDHAARSA